MDWKQAATELRNDPVALGEMLLKRLVGWRERPVWAAQDRKALHDFIAAIKEAEGEALHKEWWASDNRIASQQENEE